MIHDWRTILRKLVDNAEGDGGDYDSALYQLISETYKQPVDGDDTAVQCVLIVLHEAIRGKHDLTDLAENCVAFAKGQKLVPLIPAAAASRLYFPRGH